MKYISFKDSATFSHDRIKRMNTGHFRPMKRCIRRVVERFLFKTLKKEKNTMVCDDIRIASLLNYEINKNLHLDPYCALSLSI